MLNNIKCKEWWRAAGIRAVKTMAQTAVATIGTTTLITEIDWVMVGSATLLSGILSILTSLGGLPECVEEDSEAVDDEVDDEDEIESIESEVK